MSRQSSDLQIAIYVALTALAAGTVVLACAVAMWFAEPAMAHSWYDKECCSGSDCGPVAEGVIRETPSGYETPDGDFTPRNSYRVKTSVDGQWYWCHTQQLGTLCIYVPPRGL